ncbi:MAG: hypothetical protein L0K86_25515, partial [Actinomycetia bacterium]|nr:hypothetical protein [Actinomycetes bacterium]
VGEYTARFTLAAIEPDARYVLHLGSTGGGIGSVQVNGGDLRGFDTSYPSIDMTDLMQAGSNDVVVRVSSSLNNRLLARGYYDTVPDLFGVIVGNLQLTQKTDVHDHGLIGPVRLVRE